MSDEPKTMCGEPPDGWREPGTAKPYKESVPGLTENVTAPVLVENGYDTSPDEAFLDPSHYQTAGVQPIDLIRDAKLDFFEGNVVKYVSRWRKAGGIKDLRKALTYLQWLIENAESDLK